MKRLNVYLFLSYPADKKENITFEAFKLKN